MSKIAKNNGDFNKKSNGVYRILDGVPPPSDNLQDKIITNVMGSTFQEESSHTGTLKWVYGIAAMLLVTLGIGYLYFVLQDSEPIIDTPKITEIHSTLYAPRGEKLEYQLTPNIFVQLNADTELQIIPQKDEIIEKDEIGLVYLQGEAYFRVDSDGEGFEVLTDAGVVRVVGTAFNVWAREELVEVVVETGVVELQGLTTEVIETRVEIPQGYMSRKEKNIPAISPIPVDVEKYLSWRHGRFVFDQTPLRDVVLNLERAYNVRIVLRESELESIRVTGKFGQEPLIQILNEICWSANLRYHKEEDIYVIYQPE